MSTSPFMWIGKIFEIIRNFILLVINTIQELLIIKVNNTVYAQSKSFDDQAKK